jgi:nicotinamidase-related amidase
MKALIVIDMQEDFVRGSLGSPEAQAIVPAVAAKVAEYANSEEETIILYTRDTHFDNYMDTMEGHYLPVPHCIVNTKGWQIIPEVMTEGNVEVVDKYDFGDLGIADTLQTLASRCWESWDIDEIEIVGLCTDICVISNALILKTAFRGIPITVDSKCCAGVTPEKHEAALEVMRSCQIDVI